MYPRGRCEAVADVRHALKVMGYLTYRSLTAYNLEHVP